MDEHGITVGLLGCGTVGSEVARLLVEDPRLSARYRLGGVAVRDLGKPRISAITGVPITADPVALASRPDIDVIVEVMGGIEPASEATSAALSRGADVVSANKALVADRGPALRLLAEHTGAQLRFEAAVAAAVPVIDLLDQLVRTDRVQRIEGVLNGTCNFVLSEMDRTGATLHETVERAIELGFAEADPSRDIDGTDTADKIAVLAQLAWGSTATTRDVERLGIEALRPDDLARARAAGRTWRLVASATAEGCLVVEPRQLSLSHPLARLEGPENGVTLTCQYAGRIALSGAGAGGLVTASAVVADLERVTDRPRTFMDRVVA